ncbi:MAG: hypothetical protein GY720_12005 [bacterium]|nr:hypothetical protein [bacterium]
MGYAEQAAHEIDRLVIGINRRVGPAHGHHLLELAGKIGLQSLDLLPTFSDFLLDGLLTRQVALLRMRYRPEDQIRERLEDLESRGLISQTNTGFAATEQLRPLMKAMRSALADVAQSVWQHNEVDISVVTETARQLTQKVTDDHVVAKAQSQVRQPLDRYSLLEQRLVTLRFIRQHEHAEAWLAQGLSAPEIVLMTALWRDAEGEIDGAALESLRSLGYAKKSDPARLTSTGKKLRQKIEDETNTRSEWVFADLDPETADRFLSAMRNLPA